MLYEDNVQNHNETRYNYSKKKVIVFQASQDCSQLKASSCSLIESIQRDLNIDIIGHQIRNNTFDWENNSYLVPMYRPDLFDPDKYNWHKFSNYVAMFCSDKLDPERYNWKDHSYYVATMCPDKIDYDKYNFDDHFDVFVDNYIIS